MRRLVALVALSFAACATPPTAAPSADSECAPEKIAAVWARSPTARPVHQEQPQYPAEAIQRGIEGWVCLRFTVDEAGRVDDARVLEASPPNVFDDYALAAIRKWRYERMGDAPEVIREARALLTFDLDQ